MSSSLEKHCCNKCLNPRTYTDFVTNHLRLIQPPENSICTICLDPYGTLSDTQGHTDDACQVYGIGVCSHTFGLACIEDLKMSDNEARNQCPLCRAVWWFDFELAPVEQHPLGLRETYARNTAMHYATDYATVRYWLYREQEYRNKQLPIAWEMLETQQRWWNSIHDAICEPRIQALLERLGSGQSIALEESGPSMSRGVRDCFFEWEPFRLRWWWKWSPWQVASLVLDDVISFRGERLLNTYTEHVREHGDASADELNAIERAWMALFPDDPADCIRFELEVFAVAFPPEDFDRIGSIVIEGEVLEANRKKW